MAPCARVTGHTGGHLLNIAIIDRPANTDYPGICRVPHVPLFGHGSQPSQCEPPASVCRTAGATPPRYTIPMHMHAAPASPGAGRTQSVLRFSLVATLAYVVVTFVFGLRAHSLALLSEAGHNASDFLALLLSFAAVYFQTRPASDSKTFGYQRAGVLAAFINASTLIAISLWIAVEAFHRLSAPVAVQPRLMMYVAAAGVLMNGVIAALLWGVARDVNMRSAFIHMAGDTLSTAAVIAGGAGILLTGQNWIDPVLSLLIAALILWSSIGIVRETLNILLEGTPRGCTLPDIRAAMEAVEGVLDVHDLHVWSLGSQSRALACHVTINDIPPSESACILLNLKHILKDHFDICHSTIQFEHTGCPETDGCVVPIEEMASTASGHGQHHHHGHSH